MSQKKYTRNELVYKLNHLSSNWKKKYYFCWKNKISTLRVDYTQFSQQEFIDKFMDGSMESFKYYQHWEDSEEYNELMQLLLHQKMQSDFVDIYKAVRTKAIKGDDKAVKTFLMLQKEVNSNFKNTGKDKEEQKQVSAETEPEEEDDGLTLE